MHPSQSGPILYCIFISLVCKDHALDIDQCNSAFGMQTSGIPDDAISASSSHDVSLGPSSSRIRSENNGGAWCPKEQVSKDVYEYLQIDFNELKVITLVETQGRFGHGQGQEYTEQYLLEYQREDDGKWFRFRNRRGQEIFQGNTNTYIAEMREVDPPIIALRLRFVPYSHHAKTVCLRVEVYGCSWLDGIVAYSMPQGERRGTEVDLYDFTYDGEIIDNMLVGGLGQLTDGQIGQANFRLDPRNSGYKGYEWVGWKNETFSSNPVEIVFKFDDVRNFTSLQIHVNNMYHKEVRVFSLAKVYFSIDGKLFSLLPVEYKYFRDTTIESDRYVIVPLYNGIGKYIRVQLLFDSKWLMISEVQFESVLADGNFSEFLSPPESLSTVTSFPVIKVVEIIPSNANYSIVQERDRDRTLTTEADYSFKDLPMINRLDDEYVGIIIGTLTVSILLLGAIVVLFILRHRHYRCTSDEFFASDLTKSSILVSVPHMLSSPRNSELMPAANVEQQRNTLPASSKSPEHKTLKPYHCSTVKPTSTNPYKTVNICLKRNTEENKSTNIEPFSTLTTTSYLKNTTTVDSAVAKYPRENLKLVRKLGEGCFGEVCLCEVLHLSNVVGSEFSINQLTGMRSKLVVVKSLTVDSDDRARLNLSNVIKMMSRLNDPNIVCLIGVCTLNGETNGIMLEYLKYGDMKRFLQRHLASVDGTISRRHSTTFLSSGCLVYMASQIASAMSYLERQNLIHRNISTENCLVGQNYVVKLSDFGVNSAQHCVDYYQIDDSAAIPVRWMAWESLLLGKFSIKSDIWSFAVTLWEILVFAREVPYSSLTDDEVIENCAHFYNEDGQEMYLPKPTLCSPEIYDMMLECWNRDASQRPSFRDIHMFLLQKITGYNPFEERFDYKV